MASNVGYNAEEKRLTSFQVASARAVSGFITRLVLQPLDVFKIRFQLQIEPTVSRKNISKGFYHGMFQSVSHIVKNEGARSLWKGHVSAQCLTVIYGAGQVCLYP